jgi:hypothetical protein
MVMMTIDERANAIKRAKRALTALADHPDTSPRQFGAARDRLNDSFRLAAVDQVWAAVEDIEGIVAAVYGVPAPDEPVPRAVGRWVSPRGHPRPANPDVPARCPEPEPGRGFLHSRSACTGAPFAE